ncbi:MAG: hypothetical protein RJQ05_05850 [Cytophagales bacterium]
MLQYSHNHLRHSRIPEGCSWNLNYFIGDSKNSRLAVTALFVRVLMICYSIATTASVIPRYLKGVLGISNQLETH